MNSKTLGALAVVAVVGAAGLYLYLTQHNTALPGEPSAALGLNGSPDQGNMGGAPHQPPGDGTDVSMNLILGIENNPKLGPYLTAFNGMTVYAYAKDQPNVSNCIDACAAAWPPYVVKAASDIHVPSTILGKVGTITRADGTLQVTYNGAPLYFWASDLKIGDTMGEGIGGVWAVARP